MGREPVPAALVIGLGAAVCVAWFVSVICDIAIAGYSTPVALHGLMGTIVGAVYTGSRIRESRSKMRRNDDEGHR